MTRTGAASSAGGRGLRRELLQDIFTIRLASNVIEQADGNPLLVAELRSIGFRVVSRSLTFRIVSAKP